MRLVAGVPVLSVYPRTKIVPKRFSDRTRSTTSSRTPCASGRSSALLRSNRRLAEKEKLLVRLLNDAVGVGLGEAEGFEVGLALGAGVACAVGVGFADAASGSRLFRTPVTT